MLERFQTGSGARAPRHHRVVLAALVCLLPLLVAGCTSATDPRCQDFLTMAKTEQISAVDAWEDDHHTRFGGAMGDVEAEQDRQAMTRYCSRPGHADDRLSELDYGYGVGRE